MEIENSLDAGFLEIYKYVPQPFLAGVNLEQVDMDTYIKYLAMARYRDKVEGQAIAEAIKNIFDL